MTACLRVVLAYTNGETTYCKRPCGRYAGYAFFTNLTGRQWAYRFSADKDEADQLPVETMPYFVCPNLL